MRYGTEAIPRRRKPTARKMMVRVFMASERRLTTQAQRPGPREA
jgi:hypothetical protein